MSAAPETFDSSPTLESVVLALCAAARAGRLPDELALEVVVPTAFDSTLAPQGRHLLSARIRPLVKSGKFTLA